MGRTRKFDRDEALDTAMQVFWKHGYGGSSLDILLKEMGIKNSSFYQAFISKDALFVEVLKYYRKNISIRRLGYLLDEELPTREAFSKFYEDLIVKQSRRGYPVGCFLTNTAASLQDPDSEIGGIVSDAIRNMELAFSTVLLRGQARKEISKNLDIPRTATLLVSISYGLSVLGRTKKRKTEILSAAHSMIDVLLGKS